MSEQSLRYEDYVKGPEDGLSEEINDAASQQSARQDDATLIDWENRYKELEKLNSRQAQTLGEYRKTIDDFITNPTPDVTDPSQDTSRPITAEDIYEDPNSAVLRAVESHPAIREARELKQNVVKQERERSLTSFAEKHSDYKEVGASPEFQNWVVDNPTRLDLFQRGNQYDFNAADALFSLYKAERGLSQVQTAQNIQQAELVSSSGELVQEPPRYSRSEYIDKLTRSKQGDLDAENWVKRNAAKYREALMSGNVRD
jgi:hypothetical protein